MGSMIQNNPNLNLEQIQQQLNQCTQLQQVLDFKATLLGKNGALALALKELKNLNEQDRKLQGPLLQTLKDQVLQAIDQRLTALERESINQQLKAQALDLSLRPSVQTDYIAPGSHHPTYLVQRELEDIFRSMGFDILDGPHVEDEFHNFEALNIGPDHPARDMQDTFWFPGKKKLLRTHTSTIQVRGMQSKKPPFRFIAPGKVFRCERTDATHEMVFHQLEGMMVAKDLSIGHLVYFMKTLLKAIFKKEMEVRLRPGYFPFVEPGFELDIRWKKPQNNTAQDKYSGWLELLPCGMVHPQVLTNCGIDPQQYQGFAFGLGLDRLVMVKYGIKDVRQFHGADLRFLEQFARRIP